MLGKFARSRLTHLALTMCLIGLIPEISLAWGSSGHKIIAIIAARYLNPRAKEEVRQLSVKEDMISAMISASTWADEIRLYRPETSSWHFVDFPQNATAYVPSRDCIGTSQGDCLVATIQRFIRTLKAEKVMREDKSEPLKFLIHLIGDLHQPLHCGYKDDRGGNTIRVFFPTPGVVTSLHSAWDAPMIERAMTAYGQNESKYSDYLNNQYGAFAKEVDGQVSTSKAPETWISGWAFESYCIAVRSAYNLNNKLLVEAPCQAAGVLRPKPLLRLTATQHHAIASTSDFQKAPASRPVDISGQYYRTNLPVLEQQLVKAGIRLARVLNSIYPEKR